MRNTRLILLLLSALATLPSCANDSSNGQSGVVGGIAEPDYRYPWVVRTTGTLGCHGVLIHPKWVLTAAHCVENRANEVYFSRTDPYTGAVTSEELRSFRRPRTIGCVYPPDVQSAQRTG